MSSSWAKGEAMETHFFLRESTVWGEAGALYRGSKGRVERAGGIAYG
jgi:hypothetical protein